MKNILLEVFMDKKKKLFLLELVKMFILKTQKKGFE